MNKRKKCIAAFLATASLLLQPFGIQVYAQSSETPQTYSYGSGMFKDKEDNTKKGAVTSTSIELPEYLNTEWLNDMSFVLPPEVVTFFDHLGNLNVSYEDEMDLDDWHDNEIKVQRYDANLEFIDTVSFPLDDYYYGNVICDEAGNYYVILGDYDPNRENYETVIVKKYTYQGEYVGKCGLKGKLQADSIGDIFGTQIPFDSGNCSVAINNGVLACNFGRTMYNGHQSNYVFYMDCETMEWLRVSEVPYVSHSLDQRVVGTSEGGFLVVNKGDCFPRAFTLDVIGGKWLSGERDIELFHFREGTDETYGYNDVYAELGGIIEMDKYYVFCGTSERELSLDVAPRNRGKEHGEVRDLFIQIIDKEFDDDIIADDFFGWMEMRLPTGTAPESTKTTLGLSGDELDFVTWLTEYEDPYYAGTPKIVAISETEFVVMWELRSYDDYEVTQVYYAIINQDGDIVQYPIPLRGCKLAGRTDPIYRDGKIYWTTRDDYGANINCFEVYGTIEDWVIVEELHVTESMSLYVDETKTLETTIFPSDASDKSLKYLTSDEEVAVVDENGRITGVSQGTATITAISKDNSFLQDVCEVTVTQPVTRLNLAVDGAILEEGQTLSHYVDILPWDATNIELEWSNSDESVAELWIVREKFEIIALSEGTTVITVKAKDGSGCMDQATITVVKSSYWDDDDDNTEEDNQEDIFIPNNYVAYFGFNFPSYINVGDVRQIDYEYEMSDGSEMEFVFESTNADVITIDSNNVVTAVSAGAAAIKVKRADTMKEETFLTVYVTEKSMEDDSEDSSNNDIFGDDMQGGNIPPQNGWYYENGGKYWYENGERQGTLGRGKEIYDPSTNAWYWLDAVDNGKVATDKDVYQESDAGMFADREDGTGKWVRYDENGYMVKGWNWKNDNTYYFDETYGTMYKGYATIGRIEYFFSTQSGALERTLGVVPENGWKIIDGYAYWYENYVRQGYNVKESYRGKEIFDPASEAWYWLDNVDGGRKAVSKDVYQESEAGPHADRADGTGKWVRYDEEGHMIKGWDTNESGTYYFDEIYGAMVKGWQNIDGVDYYFDENTGVLH